ncbi:MAG: IS1 family transposase [Oscillospiraceae bacterium]|nr:IS1 family transposase [Oscillospiraceae bacterium]
MERKHLSLRTWCSRLVRKGIRFSKSHLMHKIVVSLVINFWFFWCDLPFSFILRHHLISCLILLILIQKRFSSEVCAL